jgi:hypothetical protein
MSSSSCISRRIRGQSPDFPLIPEVGRRKVVLQGKQPKSIGPYPIRLVPHPLHLLTSSKFLALVVEQVVVALEVALVTHPPHNLLPRLQSRVSIAMLFLSNLPQTQPRSLKNMAYFNLRKMLLLLCGMFLLP